MIIAMLCVNLVNLGQRLLNLYQIIRINAQLVPWLSSRICEVSNCVTVQNLLTLLHLGPNEFLDFFYFLNQGKNTKNGKSTLLNSSNPSRFGLPSPA